MRRTGAADHYFFGAAYFDRVLEADHTWLALATAPDGALAAASIAALSDGFLHYYLSGSADSHLRDSPMKNVVTRLVEHAAELDLPLNLGGGIAPATRWRSSSAASPTARDLAHLGADLRPGEVLRASARSSSPGPSSPPTGLTRGGAGLDALRAPSSRAARSLVGFFRVRPASGP